ncbi:hypothetical protein GIB64_02155 [Pseudomonas lactis]|uniref:ATP-binding protein n=1 Tax=Pseudomonas TaxID=286 RepID=UPI000BB5B717|nr:MULTISPECIES: ATP-binding protein [Pseudomonas]MBA5956220.1 hypothetical protein [Pseudomonas lactis]PRW80073.1 hypothetical protein C7A12_02545 [Pseudomonas fluorescens]PRW80848.1 hypothetical protein C7A13_06420 [Pseudomonas fluorescens]
MQKELKSAIQFDDFYTVFGPKGVVAMAWWLGALHADRIRAEHHSFPLLHIEGEAGSGKTFLMGYLWKLIGEENSKSFAPEYATPAARVRWITNAEIPVVVFESMPNEESTFDWDEIRDLYNGGVIRHGSQQGDEEIRFHGAVTIVSTQSIPYSEHLESRIARIHLGITHTPESQKSASALNRLTAQQAWAFGRAVAQREDQFLSIFNKLAPAYTASLLDEHGHQLSVRAAKNGGQLMALVDALSLLLNLTSEQRLNALSAVSYIVVSDFIPY